MLPLSSRKPCFRGGWRTSYAEHGSAIQSGSMAAASRLRGGTPAAHRGQKRPSGSVAIGAQCLNLTRMRLGGGMNQIEAGRQMDVEAAFPMSWPPALLLC